jgi:hypothetical protein
VDLLLPWLLLPPFLSPAAAAALLLAVLPPALPSSSSMAAEVSSGAAVSEGRIASTSTRPVLPPSNRTRTVLDQAVTSSWSTAACPWRPGCFRKRELRKGSTTTRLPATSSGGATAALLIFVRSTAVLCVCGGECVRRRRMLGHEKKKIDGRMIRGWDFFLVFNHSKTRSGHCSAAPTLAI